MSKLQKHANKLKHSEKIDELEQLGDAKNRHAAYIYLTHLQPSHFLHMKNAAREHLGLRNAGGISSHHYFEYPQIVLFNNEDFPILDKLAHPATSHFHAVNDLENDNINGGSMWKSFKRVAHKAAQVYSKINSGVHAVASLASKLPLPPKFQVLADSLKTGTELHGKIADVVANATAGSLVGYGEPRLIGLAQKTQQ